jgi:HlyD family secretion protein
VLYVGRPAFGQPDPEVRLYKLDGNGVASRVPVELGKSSVNLIQIVNGLNVGDKVILSDTSAFDQSDRVRLK